MSEPAEWTGEGPAPVACGARIAAEAEARAEAGGGPVPDTCLVVACPEHGVPAGVPCWKLPSLSFLTRRSSTRDHHTIRGDGFGLLADRRRNAIVAALDALGCPKDLYERHENRRDACDAADRAQEAVERNN